MLKSKINKVYTKHDCERICQGDILKDITLISVEDGGKYTFSYAVILSQDCDIQTSKDTRVNEKEQRILHNQFLPNILLVPAFLVDTLKKGSHLKELYNIFQRELGKNDIDNIKKNSKEPRYHYLPYFKGLYKRKTFVVQELIIDFKIYFTISNAKDKVFTDYKSKYIATVNELYREALSQRFTNYIARIGLPNVEEKDKKCPVKDD